MTHIKTFGMIVSLISLTSCLTPVKTYNNNEIKKEEGLQLLLNKDLNVKYAFYGTEKINKNTLIKLTKTDVNFHNLLKINHTENYFFFSSTNNFNCKCKSYGEVRKDNIDFSLYKINISPSYYYKVGNYKNFFYREDLYFQNKNWVSVIVYCDTLKSKYYSEALKSGQLYKGYNDLLIYILKKDSI